MLEEVARVFTAMSTALGVTNSAVQAPLLMYGSEAQKKKYLRRMATGETLGAFCLTEPAAGSDAAGIQATAKLVPIAENVAPGFSPASSTRHSPLATHHYLLNGTKTWVTNGNAAGVLIVFAKTDPAAGGKGISAFLVEPSFPGFRVGRHEDKMGQRSSPSVEILLNDCVVPLENRLGEEGQGLKIALSALDGGRIGIAAQAVGLAQGALEETVKYAKERKAFGKTISEFQAIQWMIADMQTEIEAARGLTYHAAWLKDAHPTKLGAASSKAKLYASEMVNRVAYKAVQVHGAVGYSRETDVERMYRDARVITIYEGTSEVQRMIIARELLGEGSKRSVAAN
jgi:alkylation response protein AidB-like acyl-CoA dehydrogenase